MPSANSDETTAAETSAEEEISTTNSDRLDDRGNTKWRAWRVTMLAGALVLLALALLRALAGRDSLTFLHVPATVTGYVLLAIGFGLAMRERNKTP